jgi:beta-glucosidase
VKSLNIPTNSLILAFAALSTLFSHGAPSPNATPLALEQSDNPAVRPAARSERWQNDHSKREARLQKGRVDILLVGDSITHGWKRHPELLKKCFDGQQVVNLGQPADKTENILWRLTNHDMGKITPQVAIVMAGTNNSNNDEYTKEAIAGGVEAIVQLLRAKLPETKILLLGIFPRGSREQRIGIKNGLTESEMNPQWEKIDRVNRMIETLADGENVVYLNINSVFLNDSGALPVTVMPDLLHPNDKGYELWGSAMMPTLEKMIESSTK